MPVPDDYLASIQPAMASYQNASFQPAPPSLEAPGPTASVQPPVTMPDPMAGGASFQPAPADTQLMSPEPGFEPKASDIPLAGGASVQPPAPAPPAAGHAPGAAPPSLNSGVTMIRGGTTPAHEVSTIGPKALAHLDKAKEEEIQASKKVADLQQTAATNQILAARVAKDDAAAQMAGVQAAQLQEQQQRADAAKRVQQAGAGLDKPITDYWSDKSMGSKIGLTIAAALGQLGEGIAHRGGNPVMGLINNAIENDAKTKQMNYQRGLAKKDAAQQDYNNVVQQIGLGPTNDRYIAAMKQKAGAEAAMQAAQSKIPEVQANAIKFQADQNAQAEEYLGKAATKLVQAQKVAPQFALAGNPIPVDAKTGFAAYEKRGEQSTEQQNKLDLAAMKAGGKGGEHQDENRRFIATQMREAGIPAAQETLRMAREATQKAGDKGIGVAAHEIWEQSPVAYEKIYGSDAAAREQAFQALANVDINKISGGAVSKEEMPRNVKKLYGAKDVRSRHQALDAFAAPIEHAERSILAGAGQSAADEYKQNYSALTPKPVAFTPKE